MPRMVTNQTEPAVHNQEVREVNKTLVQQDDRVHMLLDLREIKWSRLAADFSQPVGPRRSPFARRTRSGISLGLRAVLRRQYVAAIVQVSLYDAGYHIDVHIPKLISAPPCRRCRA